MRGTATWGWDNNVREVMEKRNHRVGHLLRLHMDASASTLQAGSYRAQTRLRLLTDRYPRYPSESRLQAEGRLELAGQIRRDAALWLSCQIEGRAYPDSTIRNYDRATGALGFSSPLHAGRFNLSWTIHGIDYRRTRYHDRTGRAMVLEYRRNLTSRVDAGFLAELEWDNYGRQAIRRDLVGGLVPKGKQRDRAREARISLRSSLLGWLMEGEFSWRSNRSNSYGYSTGTLALEGALSRWLPGTLLAQIRGRSESISYRDHRLEEVFIPREGEELESAEDNNRLLLRLSRAVSDRVTLEGRLSWFRNESLLVGEFYEKSMAAIGIVWTPVGASEI